ncbi:peptidase inhibitor family I36 protein [Flindersiella endophytica]
MPTPMRPLADALGATQATAISPTVTPYATYVTQTNWEGCEDYQVCIWSQDHYTGPGYFFGGDYAPCEGWRFEGKVLQDHTWSIWSRASGPISIWDRYADGTYRYNKYGWLPREYSHETKFSYIMDAWVYDPNNNCTSLVLHYPSNA